MQTESIDDALNKRESFALMWKLLAPKKDFSDLYEICMRRWNRMTYHEQQRMYWFIREKKRHGESTYENPLFALTYTKPIPYDWNGKKGINDRMKMEKMVSAFYNGHFGIYPLVVATIFDMTHIEPLN